MTTLRISIVVLVLALVAAACGDDDSAPETTTTTATETTTTTTEATTTTTAATTTTTEATTTTTTVPEDAHPEFGVRWADVWPDASAEATYRVTTFDGEEIDLPARMEYDVEFAGGTYDRLVVGSAEPGAPGMVIYFDRSEPWEFRVVGEEVFAESAPDAAESTYVFETPMVFDGTIAIGATQNAEGTVLLTFADGTTLDLGVTYEVTPRGIETVTVPAGDFEGALVVDALVGGELLGGDFTFPVEVALHPEQYLLRYVGASGFDMLELAEAWS